jgi:hypothetical protein
MRYFLQFIFPSRLHRLPYFARGVALDIAAGFLYANSTMFAPRYWWPSLIAIVLYGLFFVILPRICDAGMSKWWLAVALIPVANIVLAILLLFRPPAFFTHSAEAGTPLNADPAVPLGGPGVTEGPPLAS